MATKRKQSPSTPSITWLDSTEWIFAPRQDRSRKALEKILKTAQNLFVDRGYDETTLSDIAAFSGVSIGSIYKRFPDKLSILYAVLEAYGRTRLEEFDQLMAQENWEKKSALDILNFFLEVIFSSFRQDAGILRLAERQRVSDPLIHNTLVYWNNRVLEGFIQAMKPHARELRPRDTGKALRYVFYVVRHAAIWSLMSTEDVDQTIDTYDDEFKTEVFEMTACYLGLHK